MVAVRELHVVVTGEGAPVLFIHGSAADHTTWVIQQAGLRSSLRLITYDRRGTGKSPPPQFGIEPHLHDLTGGHRIQGIDGLLLRQVAGGRSRKGCSDAPARGLQQSEQGAEEGGLARAVRANEGQEGPRVYCDAHIVKHLLPPEGNMDMFARDDYR